MFPMVGDTINDLWSFVDSGAPSTAVLMRYLSLFLQHGTGPTSLSLYILQAPFQLLPLLTDVVHERSSGKNLRLELLKIDKSFE